MMRCTRQDSGFTHGYFVNDGLASVLNVMADGKSVEVGLAGKEGFIGLPLIVGLSTSLPGLPLE